MFELFELVFSRGPNIFQVRYKPGKRVYQVAVYIKKIHIYNTFIKLPSFTKSTLSQLIDEFDAFL